MRLIFLVITATFGLAAAFHLVALVTPDIGEPSPPWRHLLFAATNGAVAIGMIRRPRLFVVAFGMLTVQQLASHGAYVWNQGRLDWASGVVLVGMPLVLGLLVVDARKPR